MTIHMSIFWVTILDQKEQYWRKLKNFVTIVLITHPTSGLISSFFDLLFNSYMILDIFFIRSYVWLASSISTDAYILSFVFQFEKYMQTSMIAGIEIEEDSLPKDIDTRNVFCRKIVCKLKGLSFRVPSHCLNACSKNVYRRWFLSHKESFLICIFMLQ